MTTALSKLTPIQKWFAQIAFTTAYTDACVISLEKIMEFLGLDASKKRYIVDRLKANFRLGQDFVTEATQGKTKPITTYYVNGSCFQHLCLMSDSPHGFEARDFYINLVRRIHTERSIDKTGAMKLLLLMYQVELGVAKHAQIYPVLEEILADTMTEAEHRTILRKAFSTPATPSTPKNLTTRKELS